MIVIDDDTSIPDGELVFSASRSSGPGGQNVNKVNTRITLFFNIPNSPSLSDQQKSRILDKLSARIDKDETLRVASQRFRTQAANRKATVKRLEDLLRAALTPDAVRRKTTIPRTAHARRLACKKRHSAIKRQRAPHDWPDQ